MIDQGHTSTLNFCVAHPGKAPRWFGACKVGQKGVQGKVPGACGGRTQARLFVKSIDGAIVLKINRKGSELGTVKATPASPAAGFGGRATAASILAPM